MEAAEKEEISVEDEAVDKTIFKDCGKIAFYRRQKQQLTKTTTYQALLGSVDTEQDSTRFQIISEATKVQRNSSESKRIIFSSQPQFSNCTKEADSNKPRTLGACLPSCLLPHLLSLK